MSLLSCAPHLTPLAPASRLNHTCVLTVGLLEGRNYISFISVLLATDSGLPGNNLHIANDG